MVRSMERIFLEKLPFNKVFVFCLRSAKRNDIIRQMESAHLLKVFSILEATAGKPDGVSLTELASLVGLPKSTAHRLLTTLCSLGYIAKCGNGVYHQTSMIKRLALGSKDPYLVSIAEPTMRDVHSQTQETINLGFLRFEKIYYLHVIESTQTLRRMVSSQMSDPCFSTALGRAIIANLPELRQRHLLRNAIIEKRTSKTVIETVQLRSLLDDVARDGYAYEEDQTDLGVACIAAPIFDVDGVVAALSLSAPTARLGSPNLEQAKQLVCAGAKFISLKLQRETA